SDPLAALLLRGRLKLTPLPCLLADASQARFGGPVDPAGPFGEFHIAGEALTSGEHADLPGLALLLVLLLQHADELLVVALQHFERPVRDAAVQELRRRPQ